MSRRNHLKSLTPSSVRLSFYPLRCSTFATLTICGCSGSSATTRPPSVPSSRGHQTIPRSMRSQLTFGFSSEKPASTCSSLTSRRTRILLTRLRALAFSPPWTRTRRSSSWARASRSFLSRPFPLILLSPLALRAHPLINTIECAIVVLSIAMFDLRDIDDLWLFCDNTTAIGIVATGHDPGHR